MLSNTNQTCFDIIIKKSIIKKSIIKKIIIKKIKQKTTPQSISVDLRDEDEDDDIGKNPKKQIGKIPYCQKIPENRVFHSKKPFFKAVLFISIHPYISNLL